MARKRKYNQVRTDAFEQEIIHYEAQKNYEAATAIRCFASSCGAPIDNEKISGRVAELQGFYRHIAHGGSMLDDIDVCTDCN